MSVWQPADEIVQFLHRAVTESGADAASMTFGRATLVVTGAGAKVVHPERGALDLNLPCDQPIHEEGDDE